MNEPDTNIGNNRSAPLETSPVVANTGGVDLPHSSRITLTTTQQENTRGQLATDSAEPRARSLIGRIGLSNRQRTSQRKLTIGTWNVTSLNGKEPELVAEASRYGVELLGLSSTKVKGSKATRMENGWALYLSGVNLDRRAQAGVGVLVNSVWAERVIEWIPISERVAVLRLSTEKDGILAIVQVYAPNTEAEYPNFLLELEQAFQKLAPRDSIVLMGDFNAHVGNDSETFKGIIGCHGCADLNGSGRLLLDFCSSYGLTITNTLFKH